MYIDEPGSSSTCTEIGQESEDTGSCPIRNELVDVESKTKTPQARRLKKPMQPSKHTPAR